MPIRLISGSELAHRTGFIDECLQMTLRIVDGYLSGALNPISPEQVVTSHAQSNL